MTCPPRTTALLTPADWTAHWIARPTAQAQRVLRQIDSDGIAWADQGGTLGQTFTCAGPFRSLSPDLVCSLGRPVGATISVADDSGRVVASRSVDGGTFIPPRPV